MNYRIILIAVVFLFSCKSKNDFFNYKTEIASKVYEAQLKYLDNTIEGYGRFTKQGNYYFKENNWLDSVAEELKKKIRNGGSISEKGKMVLYGRFEKLFSNQPRIDTIIYKELEQLPITSISDIDILKVYIKNNIVSILLNNKLLPMNCWSIMASADSWTIKQGDEFKIHLANSAWNSSLPTDWYLVKNNDGLSKENILDTLKYDDFLGIALFKTKQYKKGRNDLIFSSRMKTPTNDLILSQRYSFVIATI